MKNFFLIGVVLCSLTSLYTLEKELGAFKHSLQSLTHVLSTVSNDGPRIEPLKPPIKTPEKPEIKITWPKFFAAYTYKLTDDKAISFKTINKVDSIYKVGLIDSGYIKVKNKIGVERVIEKNKKEENEIQVGGVLYNIVVAGPELMPGTVVNDFKIKKTHVTKQEVVFGISMPVTKDEIHIVYPADKLAHVQDHVIDPLKIQETLLQDSGKRESILQLLQNDMQFISAQESKINNKIPDQVEAAKKINHNDISKYLKELEQQLNALFARYKNNKEYAPVQYEKDFMVISQFKALFKMIHTTIITPLAVRNKKFNYLWTQNEFDNIHSIIHKFLEAINSHYNDINNILNNLNPINNQEFEKQLNIFKEQLLKAKEDKTLSPLPLELFKEEKPAVSTETGEETEELLDLESELLEEYKQYNKLSYEEQKKYRENEDNQDIREQLEKYKKLAGSTDVGQSGRSLLEWLRVWSAN